MPPWIHQYKPKRCADLQGQDAALKQLQAYITAPPKGKAAIIYGPSGCGKTSSVHALAAEHHLEILEVNASDVRNKEQIESVLGQAIKQRSLFSQGKLVLVDEIDGLSGMHDYGGVSAIAGLIGQSRVPIVCTAENPFDKKFSELRKKSVMIEFVPLPAGAVAAILSDIAGKENILAGKDALEALARRSGGDARAAINDLQSLSIGDGTLSASSLDALSEREQKKSIIDALLLILKTTDPSIAINSLDNVDDDLDMIFLWIDENLPSEYRKPIDLARAYDFLSAADIMRRRIRRWQHWRFLVYINAYLSAGIAVSKGQKYSSFVSYKPTTRLLKLWQANMKYQKRSAIADKIAGVTHASKRRALQDILPSVKAMMGKNGALAMALAQEFDLDEEEAAWMRRQ
ncbi:replication factor C large subunit [Candidatus Woesearchaeota archaeon]|nr:replication factor C large subunit [Candidatus Woesearchaeota archaeon]